MQGARFGVKIIVAVTMGVILEFFLRGTNPTVDQLLVRGTIVLVGWLLLHHAVEFSNYLVDAVAQLVITVLSCLMVIAEHWDKLRRTLRRLSAKT